MIRRTPIKKVLCVAEKNDAAKGIAEIMSNGRARRVSNTPSVIDTIIRAKKGMLTSYNVVCLLIMFYLVHNMQQFSLFVLDQFLERRIICVQQVI